MEEQCRILGPDPLSDDFQLNRPALGTLICWSHEQGMISRPFPAEELFAASMLVDLPHFL